jgi:hypothetical protein
MGSCDLNGPIISTEQVWAKKLHASLNDPSMPYIALGRMHTGYMALVRRLHTFCQQYGPPQKLFVVLPRAVAMEMPISDGRLLNISDRYRFPAYLHQHKKITDKDHTMLKGAVEFIRGQSDNERFHRYNFEMCTSFLKLICEKYNIELRWAPNVGVTAVLYYEKFLPLFLEDNPFLLSTCVGVAEVQDLNFDSSIGPNTQQNMCDLFTKERLVTDIPEVAIKLHRNLMYVKTHYPQEVVKHV